MIKRILIVDDDPGILEAIDLALTYSGFQVRPLLASENIFKMINNFEPDLIILDYMLKGINGGEICRQLKSNSATNYIPVIMLSALSGLDKDGVNYGYDAFIPKPFDLNHLIGKINELIRPLPTD